MLPKGEQPKGLLAANRNLLDRVRRTRMVQLVVPGKSGMNRIAAPLIAQDRLLGYLYVDMDPLYGTFNEVDSDMLGMLASQAAVALENARWTESLEQKVSERTWELNARVDELAILNSVGEAMAKTLDVKTVASIVGEKVREIFQAEILSIDILDPQTNLIHSQYYYDERAQSNAYPEHRPGMKELSPEQ